jgi:hypothetical protein
MTIPGSRRVNKKGRTTGALRNNRHTKATGQFVMHGSVMIDSPAWQVLSLSARRVLDRIEIEHMRQSRNRARDPTMRGTRLPGGHAEGTRG